MYRLTCLRALGRILRWPLVAAAIAIVPACHAQQLEHQVKAAFLYHFTKYVDWPSGSFQSSDELVVATVGEDSLGGELDRAMAGKTTGGRRIVVRHFRWGQDLSQCNILFVPAGEMSHAAQLARLKDRPVLTVGESPGFARRSGIINFYIDSGHVRFEINADAARAAGLTVSSKLLALGKPPS